MEGYAELLGAALNIWEHKLKTKHQRTYNRIVRAIRDEESKIQSDPDDVLDSKLDNLYFELQLVGRSFAANAKANVADKQG